MKNIKKILGFVVALSVLGMMAGCEELEVENLNNPNIADVLSSPSDARNVAESSFLSYWQSIKAYNIGMTAQVAADQTTVSWGNFAWRDNSEEPRTPWNNSPSYGDSDMTESIYYGLYATISEVNDLLFIILEEGMQIGGGADNNMVLATAYLIRGMALGQLGLTFDQAMIPYHDSDLSLLEFHPWNEVLEAAIADLKQAAEIAGANTFQWGASAINGITVNNTFMKELANSYAARFLTLAARNKAQNDDMSWTTQYSWGDVLTFTENGLTRDFAPEGQGLPWDGGTWWDLNIKYLRQPGWGRVDCRIINLLDPQYPVRYPTDAQGMALAPPQVHEDLDPGAARSADARFPQYFMYLAANDFVPGRGGWHFSHYRHSRYDWPASTSDEGFGQGESRGPLFELRVYDNALMMAEAMARTGNVAGAAAILNDPAHPRVGMGELPEVPADLNAVLDAIFYERDIELFHNGYLISFCDMRRRDKLQRGTPLHYPVPGRELETLEMPVYTFGGWGNADGVNTSNGGEWIMPYYHFNP